MKRFASATGGIKGVLLLVIGAAGFLWLGGQGLYTALTNRTPAVIGCAEYLQQRPTQTWLLLKGCRLNMIRASAAASRVAGTVTQVYVPLAGAETDRGTIKALLATKDASIVALATEMRTVKDEKEALTFGINNLQRLFPTRDVQGLVRFGINVRDHDREELAKLNPNLDPNFVVIDEGEQPEWTMSLVWLGFGLVLAVSLVLNIVKGKTAPVPQPRPVAAPRARPTTATTRPSSTTPSSARART